MAWDDSPPTKEELSSTQKSQSWDATPPTKEELNYSKSNPVNTTLSGNNPFNNNTNPTLSESVDTLERNLPAAGAAAGGYLAGYPGAAAGGMAGTAAQKAMHGFRQYGSGFLGHSPSMEDVKDIGGGAIEGVSQELTGRAIGKLAGAIKTSPKANAEEIQAAADRLGIKPTGGMTNSSTVGQGLESSLDQSPTGGGAAVRSEVNPVREGLKSASEDVLSGSSDESANEAGSKASKGILSTLGEKYNNIQDAYEPFNKELPKMQPGFEDKAELADKVANAGKDNLSLKRNVEQFGQKIGDKVARANNLDDIEQIRKQVSNELSGAYQDRDYNAVDGISKIQDHLNDFRDTQFEKLATQNGPPGSAGSKMGQDMVNQYKEAQGKYADLMGQLKEVGPALGIKAQNPKGFIDALTEMPEEKLADTLSKTKYVKAAQTIKDNFPETFDSIKQYQLGQIKEASTVNGKLDPSKLVREANKLSPEFKQMIFGEKSAKLSDIETLVNSLPAKMGPSGTPQGELYNQSWNPGLQGAEALRYGQYKMLTSPKVQGLLTPGNISAGSRAAGIIGRTAFDKGKKMLSHE